MKKRSPILYEPWWAFMQPEWWKWIKEKEYVGYNKISFLIKLTIQRDKEYALRKQKREQQTIELKTEAMCRGTGQPYRGPAWDDSTDATEHLPELSIDPRQWDIPRKFSSVVTYDRRWTHPFHREKRILKPTLVNTPKPTSHCDPDYIPFFYGWPDVRRLSIQDRALLETDEDGMVITSELKKGEWDI